MTVRVTCLLLWLAGGLPAAERLSESSAIESARKALHRGDAFPWYDGEQDRIQRMDVAPPPDVAARKSKWEAQPVNWKWPDWLTSLFEATGWLLLALAILLVVYALVKAVTGIGSSAPSEGEGDLEAAFRGDIDRVESLPFTLQRPQADLLMEARRQYEAGEFGQAIIYLYSYQLVQLDRHQFIRLAKGKTNRQYLRELRAQRGLGELLRGSMVAFEDVFFGHHVLNRDRFESCWRQLDEFHQQLEPGVP